MIFRDRFEGSYNVQGGVIEHRVPDGWVFLWHPAYGRPECNWVVSQADGGDGRNWRGNSPKLHTHGLGHIAGWARTIDVTPGTRVRIRAMVRSVCTNQADPNTGPVAVDEDCRVQWQLRTRHADEQPTLRGARRAETVARLTVDQLRDGWTELVGEVVTTGPHLQVYLAHFGHATPRAYNDAMIDDVRIEVVEDVDIPPDTDPPPVTGGSKLGVHVLGAPYPGQLQVMADTRYPVVKFISQLDDMIAMHHTTGDDRVYIQRWWDESHALGDDFQRFLAHHGVGDDMQAAAARWMDLMRPVMTRAPWAWYESFNEMSDWTALADYGDFEAARVRLMAAEGFRACVGNFATGTPALDAWPDFYPALEAAHEHGTLLGLHEYGGLWMALWYGPNQDDALRRGDVETFPGYSAEAYLFGRYRMVWAAHIAPNGWDNIRIVLTEGGLDRAGTTGAAQLTSHEIGAWQDLGPAWRDVFDRADREQFYLEQLAWADEQMRRDEYMVGMTIFQWGHDLKWAAFDIDLIHAALGMYVDDEYEPPSDPPPPSSDDDLIDCEVGESKQSEDLLYRIRSGYRVKVRRSPSLSGTDTGRRLEGGESYPAACRYDAPDGGGLWVKTAAIKDGELLEGWSAVRIGDDVFGTVTSSRPPQHWEPGFDAPVGTPAERRGSLWPGAWVDANPYLNFYGVPGVVAPSYHTGADLNLNAPHWDADRGAPVVAAGIGRVTFAQHVPGAWGWIVVVRHEWPGMLAYTRYAHLHNVRVRAGQVVDRGQQIGVVGNSNGSQAFYHLHFDVSTTDILRTLPTHWPGANRQAVVQHYEPPLDFIENHRP